jgi:hypothetical protein
VQHSHAQPLAAAFSDNIEIEVTTSENNQVSVETEGGMILHDQSAGYLKCWAGGDSAYRGRLLHFRRVCLLGMPTDALGGWAVTSQTLSEESSGIATSLL